MNSRVPYAGRRRLTLCFAFPHRLPGASIVQTSEDLPFYSVGEEIAHSITHGIGFFLSLGGFVALVAAAALHGDFWHITGAAIYGLTMSILYAASTLYHAMPSGRTKRFFQRMDHAAIFLLIAGTYTPFTLVSLRGSWGWTLFGVIWSLALFGIALQIVLPHHSKRLSLALYLAMGWIGVIAIEPLLRSVHPDGLMLLLLGGIAYTVGVIFYAWERLPFNHAVWHLFVLAGSACHFSCVMGYVIQ